MASSSEILDVYLIGAKDKSPSVQMRLATSIAGRYRLSATAVAEGLDGIPCRVASGVSRREAQALVDLLEGLGAVARIAPADGPGGARPPENVGQTRPGVTARGPRAAPSLPPTDLVSPPARGDGRITLKSAELQTPAVVDMAEHIDFAETGPEAQTGVRGPDTIRCPIHGLVYNRRKASGCVRCLGAARAQVRRLERDAQQPFAGRAGGAEASLRNNPVRRAFWGLAVALLLGFVPAVYYARAINRPQLDTLRARQAELSAAPATRESLARFDVLDAAIDQVHWRGAGRTLLIWLVASGAAGLVWTRLTRPDDVVGG